MKRLIVRKKMFINRVIKKIGFLPYLQIFEEILTIKSGHQAKLLTYLLIGRRILFQKHFQLRML
jgi:hypothetical protein